MRRSKIYYLIILELILVGRIKKLNDEVKMFGTSCRVETSYKRSEVIEELE